MHTSNRLPSDMSSNDYASAMERVSQPDLVDLTDSNPAHCGIEYPPELTRVMDRPEILDYRPDACGLRSAREALASYLATQGESVDPERIILTASTSEAYSFLFKLMTDPGDAIHVPSPGYPLLEHLAQMESVRALPYRLHAGAGWPLDLSGLKRGWEDKSRVLIVIRPHNPTGSWFDPGTLSGVLDLCAERDMALISDEVFRDYAYQADPEQVLDPRVMTFRLGGLSKSMGLPGWKLSWILLDGPEKQVRDSRERLEFIADTYLSVNTPVQASLKDLLAHAPVMKGRIRERILANRAVLENAGLERVGLKVWPAQGGWYAILEMAGGDRDDEAMATELLEKKALAVHPGSFYGLEPGFLVISLLPETGVFLTGLGRLNRYFAENTKKPN